MYIQITIHEHSEKQEVRQYTHSRTPHQNLQPDRCGPVLPLATTNLDFTPTLLPILHTHSVSVDGTLINLLMSYRLEMKLFFILAFALFHLKPNIHVTLVHLCM
jgi:hypothetical protein